MTFTDALDKNEIEWIHVWENKAKLKEKYLANMVKQAGADIGFNGPIFLRSLKACCWLKSEGKVICNPGYNAWTVSWNNPPTDLAVEVAPNNKSNCIETVHIIIKGKRISPIHCGDDMKYACNRTVIGTRDGKFAYYVTDTNYTPAGVREALMAAGWDNAIMLDGGGSSCIKFSDGRGFIGSDPNRIIPFYVMIKLKPKKDPEPKGDKPMVTINAYSKKKDGEKKLSNNFKVKEFACKDGSDVIFVAPGLVDILQKIRDHFAKPVIIDSAYRTPEYNNKVGGAEFSQHTYGTAADIHIKGVTVAQVKIYAESLLPSTGGIGLYTKQGFLHVDVREVKARWSE